MNERRKSIYTIPAGIPFARSLAHKVLRDTNDFPEELAKVRVFLPTRRSCRTLQDAFLRESGGRPLVLPQLQALGDVDEEELFLSMVGEGTTDWYEEIPPSISPLRRMVFLARLIEKTEQFGQGFDHALVLARALGRFMDQVYTENLDWNALQTLVPEEFAENWQITTKFLTILSEQWPAVLEEEGVIDEADRRNRLILALNRYWQDNPPDGRVIAAGSTGSIPSVAMLLSTVASLPHGEVILPGLDRDIDDDSWESLSESHPQYGFKQLLSRMEVERSDVRFWDGFEDEDIYRSRRVLAREIMRPAATAERWMVLKKERADHHDHFFEKACHGVKLFECANEREEADTISLLLRETLEEPKKTAVLITPDRMLATRVSMSCKRWGIELDDSAGMPLSQCPSGVFLRLCLDVCVGGVAPVSLLSLLKHGLCTVAKGAPVSALDKALRGTRPPSGVKGLMRHIEKHAGEHGAPLQEFLERVGQCLKPLTMLAQGEHDFKAFVQGHIDIAGALNADAGTLWAREDGKEATVLLSSMLEQASVFPAMTIDVYKEILGHFMEQCVVRPKFGTHPRLRILGQLEARMVDADLVIMGGLNEGTWPPDAGHDPWMSRPMRKDFGLPGYERSVGLASHDFVQGLCAKNVAITRAKRVEGTPTVPARWLQRLSIVLDAAGYPQDRLKDFPHQAWARTLDYSEESVACQRPSPCPPVSARPREISASRVETWLADPYSIYARYVLNLKKLDPLDKPVGPAEKGNALHGILKRFVTAHPETLPENAVQVFLDISEEELGDSHSDPLVWRFWQPRLAVLADAYTNHEQEWRSTARFGKAETKGGCTLNVASGTFTLTARADRIDRNLDGSGAIIIDYKSGGMYSAGQIKSGKRPQLAVEGVILTHGGFAGLGDSVSALEYWVLTGAGSAPVKSVSVSDGAPDVVEQAEEGLVHLIDVFDQEKTPYYSVPDPARAPRYNDYVHLARVAEWSVVDDEGEAAV